MPQVKYKTVEQEYGKPLSEIIQALYTELGDRGKVARKLGVSRQTLAYWIAISGLHEVTRLEPAEKGVGQ